MSILIKQKKNKLLRINRFLALNLNVSRRDSDILVENKSIKINGVIATHGDLVDDDDIVMHKNQVIQAIKEHEYFLFYKPYGYVSSHKRQGESKKDDSRAWLLQLFEDRGHQSPVLCFLIL